MEDNTPMILGYYVMYVCDYLRDIKGRNNLGFLEEFEAFKCKYNIPEHPELVWYTPEKFNDFLKYSLKEFFPDDNQDSRLKQMGIAFARKAYGPGGPKTLEEFFNKEIVQWDKKHANSELEFILVDYNMAELIEHRLRVIPYIKDYTYKEETEKMIEGYYNFAFSSFDQNVCLREEHCKEEENKYLFAADMTIKRNCLGDFVFNRLKQHEQKYPGADKVLLFSMRTIENKNPGGREITEEKLKKIVLENDLKNLAVLLAGSASDKKILPDRILL